LPVDGQAVPDYTTWRDREALLRPATLHRLNDRVVHLARERRITRGRKLRVDSTVIETDIHYPTDSRLLGDSVELLEWQKQLPRGIALKAQATPGT
jgi:IS5 family transposase